MLGKATRWAILAMMLLPAGCGGTATDNEAAAPEAPAAGGLTGLYEAGDGPRRNQFCMIERDGRSAGFGLVIWGERDASCGGSGLVRRDGDRLRLLLDGDESCVIEARVEGERVVLTGGLNDECARFYCGGGTKLGEPVFTKKGETEADARRAVDLVGDPLCGG